MTQHIWLHFTATDLQTELDQLSDEGRDLSALEGLIGDLRTADWNLSETQAAFNELLDKAALAPQNEALAAAEPNGLDEIRALRPEGRFGRQPAPAGLEDRVLGAWLGRAAGCLLGKPLEGHRTPVVYPLLKASGNFPLNRYIASDSAPDGAWDAALAPWSDKFFVDRTDGMPEDDDMNYTTTALAVVDQKGRGFASSDVADFWLQNIPILHTCTAERAAYRNFVNLVPPPQSAVLRNPYREWIGAQIRADYFGYINPGDPEAAAEMAWRDARISHVRNGIYGAMWAAACVAAAFCTTDPREQIRAGLGEIPKDCRLAKEIELVFGWKEEGISLEEASDRMRAHADEDSWHRWTHTNTNAMIVAIGLLWGEGGLGSTICAAVHPLYDTDCNGATAGSIYGAAHGAASLPSEWTAPLKDKLETGVKGYEHVSLSAMARKTMEHMP